MCISSHKVLLPHRPDNLFYLLNLTLISLITTMVHTLFNTIIGSCNNNIPMSLEWTTKVTAFVLIKLYFLRRQYKAATTYFAFIYYVFFRLYQSFYLNIIYDNIYLDYILFIQENPLLKLVGFLNL